MPNTRRLLGMAPSLLLLAFGLGSGVIGAATATDLVSLRAVAHAVDVPLVSAAVIGLREAMPTSLAHALEPAAAVFGGLMVGVTVWRREGWRALSLARRQVAAHPALARV